MTLGLTGHMSISVALYTLPDGCKVVIIDIIVPVTGQARASPVTDLHAQIDRFSSTVGPDYGTQQRQ